MAGLTVHQSVLLTDLALCVNRWRLFSPGWYVCMMAKVQLSPEESEIPGLVAMVNYGRKKQCEAGDENDEAFHGPPNFVLDVFNAKDDPDFLRRRERFCKHGVHEYLVTFNNVMRSGGALHDRAVFAWTEEKMLGQTLRAQQRFEHAAPILNRVLSPA